MLSSTTSLHPMDTTDRSKPEKCPKNGRVQILQHMVVALFTGVSVF